MSLLFYLLELAVERFGQKKRLEWLPNGPVEGVPIAPWECRNCCKILAVNAAGESMASAISLKLVVSFCCDLYWIKTMALIAYSQALLNILLLFGGTKVKQVFQSLIILSDLFSQKQSFFHFQSQSLPLVLNTHKGKTSFLKSDNFVRFFSKNIKFFI